MKYKFYLKIYSFWDYFLFILAKLEEINTNFIFSKTDLKEF